MKLRRNEYCPIHRSVFCCRREQIRKERRVRLGVQCIEDPHHPRGFRDLRSPAEMRKLLNHKVVEQDRICAICHEEFTDYNDIVPDHKNPKGMGEHGEITIQTTSGQPMGGVTGTRGQPGWLTDGPSVGPLSRPHVKSDYSGWLCASWMLVLTFRRLQGGTQLRLAHAGQPGNRQGVQQNTE
jgi:hypothetical protein